ncbi:MAG: hypothetical protein ACJ76H_15095 [Bacteriovoracaceae bacterium]
MKKLLFFFLFSATSAGAAQLTLITTPPAVPLDWSSPGSLFSSILKNKIRFEKRPLGLTAVKISCPTWEQTIALVPKSFSVIGELLVDGRGLGLLYHTFPGELVDPSEEVKTNLENEKTRFVRYLISDNHCIRIEAFLKDFREKKVGEKFGLPHRPLMAEGGSDTSFAVAVLEVAGVLNQKEKDSWESAYYLPDELSGMPLHEKYVNVFSLMGSHWDDSDTKASVLKIWDPQKISSWVDSSSAKVTEGKATGVELDRSKVPAPQGGWWKQAMSPEYSKKKNQRP